MRAEKQRNRRDTPICPENTDKQRKGVSRLNILVCNVGSTSLKFKLYEMPQETVMAQAHQEMVDSGIEKICEAKQAALDELLK